jgi:diguanylate cyclase (GGDEF)-like protein/hemerythrin-like metal-binding protein/PAS domain S-box-containing protein
VQFFYWNPSFEIGIASIDAQHRRLVDLINDLATAIIDGGALPQVAALIDELLDYAAQHFADEEKILDRTTLSDAEKTRHRATHRGFVEKVREIATHDDLMSTEVSERVLDFLITWLVSHILGSDRKIARSLETRTTAAGASVEDHGEQSVAQLLINALSETERRFRLISDYAPAIIWVCDPAGRRTYVNRAWCDFVGVEEDGDWAASATDHVHPDDRPAYLRSIEEVLAAPRPIEIEYRLRRADGEWGWLFERILPRVDSNGAFMGLVASAVDITAIKRSEEMLARANRDLEAEVAHRTAELERLMRIDPLTGVGNRRALIEALTAAIDEIGRPETRLTAIFVDLDHFKQINDAFGHPIGDRVLVRVAASLRANLRDDDILCRYGGEEFVVVVARATCEEVWRIAERLRAAVGRIRLREIDTTVSASAGIAVWRPGEDADAFLARADKALYRAKAEGRNRCIMDMAA